MADVNRQTSDETKADFLGWWNPRNEHNPNPNLETNARARLAYDYYVMGRCDGIYLGKREQGAGLSCHVCKKPRPEISLMLCDECLPNDQVELPPNGGSESKKGVVGG